MEFTKGQWQKYRIHIMTAQNNCFRLRQVNRQKDRKLHLRKKIWILLNCAKIKKLFSNPKILIIWTQTNILDDKTGISHDSFVLSMLFFFFILFYYNDQITDVNLTWYHNVLINLNIANLTFTFKYSLLCCQAFQAKIYFRWNANIFIKIRIA